MCCLRIEDKFVRTRCNAPPPPNEVRKRRCRVEVWIEQGIRNGRMTTPTLEEIVPCRPASHAGRERVWGSCGERGQKFGSRWVDQPSQEVVPFLSIRINPPVKKGFFYLKAYNALSVCTRTGPSSYRVEHVYQVYIITMYVGTGCGITAHKTRKYCAKRTIHIHTGSKTHKAK